MLSCLEKIFLALLSPLYSIGCESWTIKKAEHQRIDAFGLWCWKRFLIVPWTARRSNQSILKEISPGCSLEGLMLKLKLQYFGHLNWRADSFEKTLMLGKIEGRRRRGWQRHHWMASLTQWTWVWVNSGSWWGTGRPGVLQLMGSQTVRHNWVTELNYPLYDIIKTFPLYFSKCYIKKLTSLMQLKLQFFFPSHFQVEIFYLYFLVLIFKIIPMYLTILKLVS